MTKQRTKPNTALWVVLASALALRLALALVTEGYPYDMSCFVAWGDKLAAQGPAAFYSEGYFADYPPGYLWVLGLVGAVRAAFGIAYESRWTYLLLALVPSVCDCVSAALVYAVARRGTVGRQMALALAAFTAFDPLLLFDTAVWKQIDGAFTLPLLLCFLLLEQRRYLPAAVWFGLALAIKPQALLFGPVLAACFLAGIAVEQDRLRLPLRQHQRFQLACGAGRQLEKPVRACAVRYELAAAGLGAYPAGHGGACLFCGMQQPQRPFFAAAAGGLLRHRHLYALPLHA